MDDKCVDDELQKNFNYLEQLCGTPNIYRRFDDTKPGNSKYMSPHQHATAIYKYFQRNKDNICLELEFDLATVMDLLNQNKKENRLYYKIRDVYLRDHNTTTRHHIKKLFYHFKTILEPDKSSINGLTLNYITVLFAPLIIHVKINDESNPVLIATIQTSIFQTIFHRMNGFFSNIDRTNQINPTNSIIVKESDAYFNIEKDEKVYYEYLYYKKDGVYKKDEQYCMVRTARGIGICPLKCIKDKTDDHQEQEQQNETISKDDLTQKDVNSYHDWI